MITRISEGAVSVDNILRIVRMRGRAPLASTTEVMPFRRLPPPIWKLAPNTEPGHGQQHPAPTRPA